MAGQGEAMPDPKVPDYLTGVWRAWGRLNRDRPWVIGGMGDVIPRNITFGQVVEWCRMNRVPGSEVLFFDQCIRAMDDVYLKWHGERRKAERGGGQQ